MKLYIKYIAIILLVFNSIRSIAQYQGAVFLPDTSFKVYSNNVEKTIAFSGGFNNPQFSIADLNHDGKNDLIVYEKQGEQILTFINKGTGGNPDYHFAPKYAANFPKVFSYLIMLDYNCDGITDLFHRGMPGYEVYKGYYNTNNELCFQYYKSLWYLANSGWVNAYCDPGDVPGIADIDNDGDLDFFAFSILGAQIQWYRNRRVEDGLPCDSIRIEPKDKCWGKLFQGFTMTQTLHISCPNFLPDDNINDGNPVNKTTLHTGNNLCMFDYDGDGDMDYLNGGISYPYIQLLINGKANYGTVNDTIVAQDTTWQTGGHIYNKPVYPAAYHVDYDGDGKKDILLSPSSISGSDNNRCISWYKNTGTTNSPVFTYNGDSLLSNLNIDLGTGAYPAVFDYDRDGKPDLLVGSDGYYQAASGLMIAKLSYYKNTSTPGNPSFRLENDNLLNLFAKNFAGAYPAIGDLNNDGKEDLLIAHSDGTISVYKDTATLLNVPPSWVWVTDSLRDVNNALIDSTQFPAPFIYDVDTDGKQDLVIGTKAGWLMYYKNVGIGNGVKLQYVTSKLGIAKSDPWNLYSAYATPFIGKIDNSGNDYLLMGSYSGALYRYSGFKGATASSQFVRLDSLYSFIDSSMSEYSAFRSVPAVADFDADGKYEMLIGNILGGLQMFKQVLTVGIGNEPETYLPNVVLYPNPAKDVVTITWEASFVKNAQVQISLYAMTGQLLSTQTVNNENECTLNVKALSTGIYQCVLMSGENKKILKLVKID